MRRMPLLIVAAAAMIAFVGVNYAAAQPRTVVIKRNLCKNCGIAVDTTLKLGDPDGPGEVDANPWLSCSSKGIYAATKSPMPKEVLLFDADGRFLKSIGRSGSGPGEFQRAFPVRFGPGDSLSVFDMSNARRTLIGPDLRTVRMTAFPHRVIAGVPLSNGSVVMYSPISTPQAIGLPLHLVDGAGKVQLSFGATTTVQHPDNEVGDRRRVALSRLGVWSSYWNDYKLEEWDVSGNLLRTLVVPTPWFPPWTKRVGSNEIPNPVIVDIQEDRGGLLWVLIAVADKRFRPIKPGTPRADEPSNDEQSDTVIEVVDPARGVILASKRVDKVLNGFACEHTSFASVESPDGGARIGVWKFNLQRNR